MKTKTAFALSLTGILLTGSAALAANTQTLNSPSTDVAGDAGTVLLKDDSASHTPTASPSPTTTAAEPGDDKGGLRSPHVTRSAEPGDDKGGLRSPQVTRSAEPGDDKGGLREAAEPGDDKGRLRKSAEPGDDGGHGRHGGHGSDD
jgi:hypothetical protein